MGNTAEDLQIQSRGPQLAGWPAWRYGVPEDQQVRHTQTDYLRVIDREVNSVFDLKDAPTGDQGTLVGQVLALRREVKHLTELLESQLSPPKKA